MNIKHSISKFHMWLLRRIVRQNIVQGAYHHNNTAAIFSVVSEHCRNEFNEDNCPTQYYFLMELLERGFFETHNTHMESMDSWRKSFANHTTQCRDYHPDGTTIHHHRLNYEPGV